MVGMLNGRRLYHSGKNNNTIQSTFNGFLLLLRQQITRVSESTAAQEGPFLQPSLGHRPVPTKHLVSTDTFKKEKKTKTPQSQLSEAGAVTPKFSSQPDTPCTSAAVPKIDVSATL